MKITPVLLVDRIEPVLEFWTGRLGFEKTVEVPDGDHLSFVILQKGAAEVMYQTRESAARDIPATATMDSMTWLFVEVEDFGEVLGQIAGLEVLLPERTTFYGMREIVVREPGGHGIVFAARVA